VSGGAGVFGRVCMATTWGEDTGQGRRQNRTRRNVEACVSEPLLRWATTDTRLSLAAACVTCITAAGSSLNLGSAHKDKVSPLSSSLESPTNVGV
jgi:hypothetical protein